MDHRLWLSSGLVLALAAPAAAQTDVHRSYDRSFGAAAQFAMPLTWEGHGGIPGARLTYREWTKPSFGIEADFGWWREREKTSFTSPPPYAYSYQSTETLNVYGAGVNLLGRVRRANAAFVAGGGPAMSLLASRYENISNGVRHGSTDSSFHFGVRGLADIEVRATDRVWIFGGVRAEVVDVRFPRSFVFYPTVGVRLGF